MSGQAASSSPGASSLLRLNIFFFDLSMSPNSATRAVVAEYLELGSIKPFSQLIDLSRFASSLVMSEPRPPRIFWDGDVSAVSIDGERITLNGLQGGLTAWIQELNGAILELTGEGEVPDWLADGRHLVDNPRERTPGYSFLNDPRFLGADGPLMERLITHDDWTLGVLDHNSSWRWNRASLIRFFSASRAIQERLMPLLQIASKTRGTELADTCIRNSSSRSRTLMVYNGRLYNNMAYTKTTELMEHNSFLPCLIPEEISRPLIHYLAVIRPVEILLSGKLWSQEQQKAYQTHLFVVNGEQLGSGDDSDLIHHFFQEHCNGAFIKLNRWRQVSASISREFIDELAVPRLRRSDFSMGHSTVTARLHYSQDHDTPDFLTSDAIQEQTWIDEEFHSILGLGRCPCPVPQRLKQSTQAAQIQEIKEGLSTMSQQLQDLPDSLAQLFKTAIESMRREVILEAQEQVRVEISTHLPPAPLPPLTPSRPLLQPTSSSLGKVLVEATPTPTPHRPNRPTMLPIIPSRPTTKATPTPSQNPSASSHHPKRPAMLPIPSRPTFSQTSSSNPYSPRIPVRPTPTPPQGSPSLKMWPTLPGSSPEWSQELSMPPPRQPSRPAAPSSSPFGPFYYPSGASQGRQSISSSSNVFESTSDLETLQSCSQPSSPSPLSATGDRVPGEEEVIHATIHAMLQQLHGPGAKPKSQAQFDLCVHSLRTKENIVAILPTGGGKSTAWMVVALARPDETAVVIVPFKGLLEQHLKNAKEHGCKAVKWTARDKVIPRPGDKNLLFVACETAVSSTFQK